MSTVTRPDINVDCEPGSYADKARGYVERQLRRGSFSREYAERHVGYAVLKDEFAARHGVREYKYSTHNLAKLFRSAGASTDQARSVFSSRCHWGPGARWNLFFEGDFSQAFDHHDLWGRDGKPLMLVGHPYGDPDQHRAIYDAIAALGLDVQFGGESYYGYGTYQVIARAPAP
jgi:hypothetical protein